MRFLAAIGALAILAVVAGAVYFFGGYYSVAATEEHFDLVSWTLRSTRQASIEKRSAGAPPVSLEDAEVVQAGARAYAARGCVLCHGAPGLGWEKFSEGMRPYPPNLNEVVKVREPGQLFWVVRNGIKMTGMPGFALIGADDTEIWSIVAFVRKMATVSEADFKAWSAPASGAGQPGQKQ
jgi:mono/diheme cytochrome c family protein